MRVSDTKGDTMLLYRLHVPKNESDETLTLPRVSRQEHTDMRSVRTLALIPGQSVFHLEDLFARRSVSSTFSPVCVHIILQQRFNGRES